MNGVAQLKSLGDIRTVIGSHLRSTPRQKGSAYLDILALGMEQMRLETESAWHAKRQGRIERRLGESRLAMGKQIEVIQGRTPAVASTPPLTPSDLPGAAESASGPHQWRHMPVDY